MSALDFAVPAAEGFATGGPVGGAIALGSSLLGSLFGGKKLSEADKLQQERLAQARALQNDRNTLRAKAMLRLGNIPQSPDLGSLFAGSQNPFARSVHIGTGGTPPLPAWHDPGPSSGDVWAQEQLRQSRRSLPPLQPAGAY
jgi:hypothetical protein